ncbi:MAG: GerMN domain-containing protein [Acidobacteriota bacterium]|nr:GerMN domain-containing protein [Acidobacteriota bacterium]
MSRRRKIAIATLVALVAAGVIYLPGLYQRVVGLRRMPVSEEAERRAVIEPPLSTSTDQPVKARMFWASATVAGTVDETDVDTKLSADPVERGKQLLTALIAGPPDPSRRTLPPGTTLLEFYLLPEGTAVADFSNTLSTAMPSGIQSEQLAVESIGDTLAANIPALRRLKILIDGQEAKTLAGHIDLTGYFMLHAPTPAPPATGTDPAPQR